MCFWKTANKLTRKTLSFSPWWFRHSDTDISWRQVSFRMERRLFLQLLNIYYNTDHHSCHMSMEYLHISSLSRLEQRATFRKSFCCTQSKFLCIPFLLIKHWKTGWILLEKLFVLNAVFPVAVFPPQHSCFF